LAVAVALDKMLVVVAFEVLVVDTVVEMLVVDIVVFLVTLEIVGTDVAADNNIVAIALAPFFSIALLPSFELLFVLALAVSIALVVAGIASERSGALLAAESCLVFVVLLVAQLLPRLLLDDGSVPPPERVRPVVLLLLAPFSFASLRVVSRLLLDVAFLSLVVAFPPPFVSCILADAESLLASQHPAAAFLSPVAVFPLLPARVAWCFPPVVPSRFLPLVLVLAVEAQHPVGASLRDDPGFLFLRPPSRLLPVVGHLLPGFAFLPLPAAGAPALVPFASCVLPSPPPLVGVLGLEPPPLAGVVLRLVAVAYRVESFLLSPRERVLFALLVAHLP